MNDSPRPGFGALLLLLSSSGCQMQADRARLSNVEKQVAELRSAVERLTKSPAPAELSPTTATTPTSPVAAAGGSPRTEQPALILVKVSETRMVADGRPVSDAELSQLLRKRMGDDPGLQVLIEAQPKVPHKRVAALFDLAKNAGAENIALVSGPLPKRARRR